MADVPYNQLPEEIRQAIQAVAHEIAELLMPHPDDVPEGTYQAMLADNEAGALDCLIPLARRLAAAEATVERCRKALEQRVVLSEPLSISRMLFASVFEELFPAARPPEPRDGDEPRGGATIIAREQMPRPANDLTRFREELRAGIASEAYCLALTAALRKLSYREREIVKLRTGLGDGYTYTLDEVGHIFKVTRERIRYVEAKALRKLMESNPELRNGCHDPKTA